jgi:hypothetical protein
MFKEIGQYVDNLLLSLTEWIKKLIEVKVPKIE